MKYIDCFNGDADGICALTQLRLATPVESELITGVKRDISLVKRVSASAGDQVTVLDVSLDKNRDALLSLLDIGANVFYSDHHFAGDIPEADNFTALINTSADVCTSLLVDKHLNGQFREWAVVGTFGDNLKKSARGMAKQLELSEEDLVRLENLGIYINYNGYGSQLEDLYFHPADLFKRTVVHATPTSFMQDDIATFETLEQGYKQDMANAQNTKPSHEKPQAAVYVLPNEPWARRVSGVFGNDLANQYPDRAHGVVTQGASGGYVVSVRAPLNNKTGADEICRQFPTGGGRSAAAGINDLPADSLPKFVDTLCEFYA